MDNLSDSERLVVDSVRQGVRQVFPLPEEGGEKPVIAAALLRRLALRQPILLKPGDAEGEVVPLTAAGIQIENARIHGQIDLDYFGAGDALGALTLVLKNCDLLGDRDREDPDKDDWKEGEAPPVPALMARGARFAHLSLENSRFGRIDIKGAHISGDVDVCGVGPLEDGDYCWVQARAIEVFGSFRGDKARLKLAARRAEKISADRPKHYALELSEATIRGSMHFNAADAEGGVILKNGRITGDVWMIGASIEKGEADALVGDSLHVGGGLGFHDERSEDTAEGIPRKLRRPFKCVGCLSMSFAHVSGTVSIFGAIIGDESQRYSAAIEAWHLTAGSISIGYDDKSAKVFGHMILAHARVNGDVRINAIARSVAQTLTMDRAVVGGSVVLMPGSELSNGMTLEYAEIGRDLDFNATCYASSDGRAIGASSLNVKGHVRITGEVSGAIDLEGATVDGDVRLGATDRGPLLFTSVRNTQNAVNLANARVARALRLDRVALNLSDFTQARTTSLPFYKGWSLVEAQFPGQKPKLACFLVRDVPPAELRAKRAGPDVIALNGTSPPIHAHNEKCGLTLETDEQVKRYISFFCAHVWGPEGPFKVVESAAILPPAQRSKFNESGKLSAVRAENEWRIDGWIVYGPAIFEAKFRIQDSSDPEAIGRIEMLEDNMLGPYEPPSVLYQAPYRIVTRSGFGTWPLPPPHEGDWSPATPVQEGSLKAHLTPVADNEGPAKASGKVKEAAPVGKHKRVMKAGETSPAQPAEIVFDVSGARIGLLDDDLGRAWPEEAELKLGGLHYERLSETDGRVRDPRAAFNAPSAARVASSARGNGRVRPTGTRQPEKLLEAGGRSTVPSARATRKLRKARWQARQDWLKRQYKGGQEPTHRGSVYNPQPYEQLIQALHAMGDSFSARKITSTKLNLERRLREEGWWAERARWLSVPFLWLYAVFFDNGLSTGRALATFFALWLAGALAAQVALTGFPVQLDGLVFLQGENPVLAVVKEGVVTHRPCGGNINAIWYALDSFVPLIDLKQESRCDIRPERWGWVAAKSWYALLGWLVTSLAALTVSGLLRRYAER